MDVLCSISHFRESSENPSATSRKQSVGRNFEKTNNIHRCGPRKVMRAFTSALDRHSFILKQPKPQEKPTTSFTLPPRFIKSHSVDSTAVSPLAIDSTDYVSTLARKLSTKQNTPSRGQASPTSPTAETELRNLHAKILLVDDNPINLRVCFSFALLYNHESSY